MVFGQNLGNSDIFVSLISFVFVQIVADKADEILSIDCDMASLHTVITKFPTNINDFEKLETYISSAVQLFQDYPPDRLVILNEKWQEKW